MHFADTRIHSAGIDSQAVSLAITESWNTTSPPEPKFFVKFILGPEPDSRIRRKKLHTGHRLSQNRFFENLYKSLFPRLNMPGNPPEHAQIIPRSSPEPPKIDPKTAAGGAPRPRPRPPPSDPSLDPSKARFDQLDR